MKIIVATTQVPFVRGGAEILAEGLITALKQAGHEAEIVMFPYLENNQNNIYNSMLFWQAMDLEDGLHKKADLVIGLKFPAYLVPFRRKVLWVLHQYRQVYDLWNSRIPNFADIPYGRAVKEAILSNDQRVFKEVVGIFTISKTVTDRIRKFNDFDSQHLYPPVFQAEKYLSKPAKDYFYFPSRISFTKRHELVLEALSLTKHKVKCIFAGKSDSDEFFDYILRKTKELGLEDRVSFLGYCSSEKLIELYAECLAVIFPPYDEDYGLVTLEGMLASKPVITCRDSGGPTEFIENGETGFVCDSLAQDLANCLDSVWENRDRAATMGKLGLEKYHSLDITWNRVLRALIS